MVAVAEPAPPLTPETTPKASTEAVPEALEDQVPEGEVQLKVVVCPTHTVATPVREAGSGLIVPGAVR